MKRKIFFAVSAVSVLCALLVYFTGLVNGGGGAYLLDALPFLICVLVFACLVASSVSGSLAHSENRRFTEKLTKVKESLKSLNAGEFEPLETSEESGKTRWLFEEINTLNKSTQKAMAKRERELEKLKAVLDNVAQGIVAMNGKNEIVFVNESALEIFRDGQRIVGNSLAELIGDKRLCGKIAEHRAENPDFSFSYEYNKKTYEISGRTISDATHRSEISRLLIFTDVTAEKDVLRQKSDFFANASHELKTPLTVMCGLTEILLEEENLTEREKKQLTRLHKESVRMTGLISDMLKISRLERSEEEEIRENVDVREIALEAAAELVSAAQEKGVSVTVEGEGKVFADPKNIFELTTNLLSNAVHYNKENGWVRVHIEEKEKTTVLCVEDGGIGIEKEHLPRLCERFYRVDKSRSKKTGGTGLGLAIVKHICAAYGARLTIESEFGEGTRVTVEFDQ